MIAKALESLKKNPVVVVFYVLYLMVVFAITYVFFANNLGANPDPAAAFSVLGKILLGALIMGVIGIVFFAGYGKMAADAVTLGETSTAAFGEGVKKFFVRVLLAALLLFAFYLGFSIVIGIIMIPFSIMFAMNDPANAVAAGAMIGLVTSGIMMLIIVFVAPFIMLWFPAIFVDDIGVMEGLKRGAKAAVKGYWFLVLSTFIMYLPSVLYMVFNYSSMMNAQTMTKANMFTPAYLAMCLISAVLGIVFMQLLIVVYNEKKSLIQA
ncbi:MAG: hypothetical protein N2484_05275 [Clostridia bacterium]|nr:hypothetical protein [Clostridia bacterium]